MLPLGFGHGGHLRSMEAFAQLEGAFPSLGHMKMGWLLQLLQAEGMLWLSAGLVVIAAQANVMTVCAASEHENSDTFTGKCREQS